ncbi:hypothetical protein ACFRCG_09900 [Embleya sp. NPDC056575]
MAHDDTARRVAYAVIGGSMAPKHHHASMQVLAGAMGEMAEQDVRVIRR